jgi:predicted Zn-dependent protease
MSTRLALSLVAVALCAACATNPVSGKKQITVLSEAEELEIGRQMDAEIQREMGIYDDPALQGYVAGIGARLAEVSHRPELPWTFQVVDVPAVNAFALPGGYVYVTRGLLAYAADEAELAGVLGHEIGHVTARHAAEQYTRSAGTQLGLLVLGIFVPGAQNFSGLAYGGLDALFTKYSRDDENQSDRLGIEYAAKAGWDPHGMPRFLATLSRIDALSERGVPNWLSTHPDPASRVEIATPLAVAASAGGQALAREPDAYLRRVTGLMYGDNPKDGIVRGDLFLHPALRFAVTFPEGWEVRNSPEQVVAQAPGEKHVMLLQQVTQTRGAGLDEAARRQMKGAGFTFVDGEATQVNGLDAFRGIYRGSLRGMGKVLGRAVHVRHGRQVYVLAGFAPEAEFDRVAPQIATALDSFRPLSRTEAADVQPNQIDVVLAQAGDTWQALAQRHGAIVPATTLALMNGHAVNELPREGERLKIVVAGSL